MQKEPQATGAPTHDVGARSRVSSRAVGASVLLAIVAVLLLATLHETREGSRALLASDVAMAAKNPDLAVAEAFDAATHVAPFSPWSEQGFTRLQSIAEDAETRGDDELAETAWRALRAAEVSTRSPFSSDGARRKRAESALARIDARRMLVTASRSPGFVRFEEGQLAKMHGRDPTPATTTFAVLGLGASLALGAAILLARSGFAFRGRVSLFGAGLAAAGAALVALALSR